jgi:hypothetical protein
VEILRKVGALFDAGEQAGLDVGDPKVIVAPSAP